MVAGEVANLSDGQSKLMAQPGEPIRESEMEFPGNNGGGALWAPSIVRATEDARTILWYIHNWAVPDREGH